MATRSIREIKLKTCWVCRKFWNWEIFESQVEILGKMIGVVHFSDLKPSWTQVFTKMWEVNLEGILTSDYFTLVYN